MNNKPLTKTVKSKVSKGEIKKVLKEMADEKFVVVQFNTSVDAIGTITKISGVTYGTAVNQHVGPYIMPSHMEPRLVTTGVSSDAWNVLRYVFFQWHPNDSLATPLVANILDFGYSGSNRDPTSPFNKEFERDYTILYDSLFYIAGNGSAAGVPATASTLHLTQNRIRTPRKIRYNPGVQTGENQVYLLVISDSTVTPHPAFYGTVRLYYTDI